MRDRSVALRRTAVTATGYATLATFAWFIYTFGPTVPLLRAEQETSRAVASLHNVAFAVGVVVTGMLGSRVLRRLGRDGAIRLGVTLLTVGGAGLVLGSLPDGGTVGATLAAAFVAGTGGALSVNAATAVLSTGHGAAGAAANSEGNAVAATIGVVAPLAVGGATALGATWRAATLVVVPLAIIVWLLARRAGRPAAFATDAAGEGDDDVVRPALPPSFWLLMGALVACIMVEGAFVTWTPDLLRDNAGLGAGAAAAATAAFLAGMAVGRFAVARLALQFDALRLFAGSLVLAIVGWLALWATPVPAVALTGLVIAGLGAAGHFPLGSVLMIDASDGQADHALSWMAVGLGCAVGAGPFVLGSIADRTGILLAFLMIPACLVAALGATALASRAGTVGR